MSSLPTRKGTPTVSEHKTTMSSQIKDCDLDLECVTSDDLVLFQPIRGTCLRGQNVIARYSLGSDFTPSTWDWVGLFHEGWTSYRDYISYQWAPSTVTDPRRNNRRSVLFTSEDFESARTVDNNFKFLYVTAWNHVVGVSTSFRLEGVIGEDEDLCFDLLENSIERPLSTNLLAKRKFSALELFPDKGDLHFDVLERTHVCVKKSKPSLKPFAFANHFGSADICHPLMLDGDLEFDLLEKLACQQQKPMKDEGKQEKGTESTERNIVENLTTISKDVAKKEKVLTVVRDHETLAATFSPEKPLAPDTLQFLFMYPVVKNYIENTERSVVPVTTERSVVPYDVPKPIFDINNITSPVQKVTEMPKVHTVPEPRIPEIEFPVRLPIMPGPKSVLFNTEENPKRCTKCVFGKTTTADFIRQEERADKAMNKLREEIRSLKKQIQHAKAQRKLMAKKKDIRYQEVVETRIALEETVQSLKEELGETKKAVRESAMKVQLKLTPGSLTDSYLVDAFHLLQERGYKLLVDNQGGSHALMDLHQGTSQEDGWMTRSPKKIARMRSVLSKQSATIQNLAGAVIALRESISRHTGTVHDLRQQVVSLENANKDKDRKILEMTKRIRGLLSSRGKDLTNEWRLFAKKITEPSESTVVKAKVASRKFGSKKGKATSSAKPVIKFAPYMSKKAEDTISPKTTRVSSAQTEPSASSDVAFVNENAPENKVVRRKRPHPSVRLCNTCGQSFGPEVSAHVVEEHLLFHERFGQRKIFM